MPHLSLCAVDSGSVRHKERGQGRRDRILTLFGREDDVHVRPIVIKPLETFLDREFVRRENVDETEVIEIGGDWHDHLAGGGERERESIT